MFQFLCDIEYTLNFLEVRVLVYFQILWIIWSKTNGCSHWRRHEQSQYQYIGLHCFHCKCWVTCCDSQLLQMMENLRDLHALKICLCVHWPHRFPWASRVRRFMPISMFPRVSMLSVFLSPHLRIFDWILAWVSPHRLPGANLTASLFIDIFWIDWVPDLAEGFSSHSTGCASPDSRVSPSPGSLALVSPLVNLHWKSLLALSSTWRSAFWSDQKENCWKSCKRTSRNSKCLKKRRRWFHSSRVEKPFGQKCPRVGFWRQHNWFGPLVQKWFCRTTNQAQLCGFGTRVSLLDFVHW